FGDRRPAAAALAGAGAARRVDDRQPRILGHRAADGAPGAAGADRPGAASRRAQLVVHEYGMRVGVWRFFDLFARLGIRPTLSINARVCEDYPRVARQARDAGWEFMGHAYEQMPIHRVEDQKAMIERSLSVIEQFTGTRPVGWLGPGLTQTEETPELLAAAGIKYIGDWVYDDEPTEIHTDNGPLVTLPYTVELNDIPMMLVQHHESEYFTRRCLDTFDRLYAEGASRAKVM